MATINKTPKGDTPDKTDKKARSADGGGTSDLITYLKGVRSEWTKISWPTWPQIWGQTIVVLVMVSIMTLGLWILDNTFRWVIDFITPGT